MTPVAPSEKTPHCNATLDCRHQHWRKVAHQFLQASQCPEKMFVEPSVDYQTFQGSCFESFPIGGFIVSNSLSRSSFA